ncbi:MAG: bifunctional adenosylcobinamide kinase/adenosylcobinamide-phosphate guanylyltransferase [Oscillospiraceae bacterium]|jgi:adenosylcobinamide kinase/adenosylcobinamide-phosphate guanylyltransferase
MTIFISGGCKNGKSSLAQNVAIALSKDSRRYYVATMIPSDEEDETRISRHLENRADLGFETIERGRDILGCLEGADETACFLVDSVTALLANEMFREGEMVETAPVRVAQGLLMLADRVKNAVFVSDYIYSDAARFDESTETYRRGLAFVDRALAGRCDTVVELCAGDYILHKGVLPL